MQFLFRTIFYMIFMLILGGCVYPNDCGISRYVYDDKEVYYDSQGSYHENCPRRNILNFNEWGIQ